MSSLIKVAILYFQVAHLATLKNESKVVCNTHYETYTWQYVLGNQLQVSCVPKECFKILCAANDQTQLKLTYIFLSINGSQIKGPCDVNKT